MGRIHATAIVEDGASLGADVEIGPFCVIGARAKLGDGVRVASHVVIMGDTEIGPRTSIYSHAVLGGGPQFKGDEGLNAKLVIGADNVIREHVTMNGGSVKGGGATHVGDKGFFMAYSHVAHDCHIGHSVTFANGVALAGHVVMGDGVIVGGLAAIQQFSRIGRAAFIGGVTGVPDDVIPYGMVVGDRARLLGLNLIGLKRRGLSRDAIHALRAAYRFIFFGEGLLAERAQAALQRWAGIEQAREIAEFVLEPSKRPICMPRARISAADADKD
jgi:UDP-N-acetylglucosamine acyltransferase